MVEKTKKKRILGSAIDAMSNRDEKSAEALRAEAIALQTKKAAEKAAASKKATAEKKVADARLAAQKAIAQKTAAVKAQARMKAAAAARAAVQKAGADRAAAVKGTAKPVVRYVLKEGDTWTHVALKFYGHTTEPYWRPIYEANKAMVGDDYHRIWAGMEIIIPELPEELKGKK